MVKKRISAIYKNAQRSHFKKLPREMMSDFDTGTPELHRQEVIEVYGADRKSRARVVSSPIDWYLAREYIDKDQHNAAITFYRIWWYGGGRVNYSTMNLNRIPGARDEDFPSAMRQRYRRACEAFSNPLAAHMVHKVVCEGEYASAALKAAIRAAVNGSGRGDVAHKGMMHLKRGLDDLVLQFSSRKVRNAVDNIRNQDA